MAYSGLTFGFGDASQNDRLATAIGGFAKAFEPPSGTDIYAYAKAAQTRAEIAQKADFLKTLGADPNVGATAAALLGLTGNPAALKAWSERQLFNKSQSLAPGSDFAGALDPGVYALNGDFGKTGAGNRQQQDADMRKALGVEMAKPITTAEGSITTLPAATAAATGLPQTITGIVKTPEGSSATLPDGRVILGPEKQDRSADGTKTAPNYKKPDGSMGTAKLDPVRGWVDTQSGNPIPPGSITFQGLPPAAAAGSTKTQNWKAPDGSSGTAVIGPDGIPRNVDGSALPPGAQLQQDLPGKAEDTPEAAAAKARVAGNATRYVEAHKAIDDAAETTMRKAEAAGQLETIQNQIRTGAGVQAQAGLARVASIFGVKLNSQVGLQEQFQQIANQLVLESVSALGTNPSNADRDFIERTKPNLANQESANRFYIEQARRQAIRARHVADMARQYSIDHGGIDEQFLKQRDDYLVANPINLPEILRDPAARARYEAEIAARSGTGANAPSNGGQPAAAQPGVGTVAPSNGGPPAQAAAAPGQAGVPDMSTARRAPDGNLYVPDPARPGKYLRVKEGA